GIRDFHVTGVQTCALPIYLCTAVLASGVPARQSFGYSDSDAFAVGLTCGGELEVFVQRVTAAERPVLDAALTAPGAAALVRDLRSEERRVGKECRARWQGV